MTPNEGDLTAQKATASANADTVPALDGDSKTYFVYSPRQFLYAARTLKQVNSSGYTINIMCDFDMGGAEGMLWPTDVALPAGTTVDGDPDGDGTCAILYNLKMLTAKANKRTCGFIQTCPSLQMKNIRFTNGHIIGGYQAAVALGGLVPSSNDQAAECLLQNVSVADSVVISRSSGGQGQLDGGSGALMGRYQNTSTGGQIRNCNAQDCIVVGVNHQGSLTSTLLNCDLVSRCFSVGCTVISFGNHSGGLVSCAGNVSFADCFTDVDLYGSEETGVFLGNINGTSAISDCFASGFIEGASKIGGFVGSITGAKGSNVTIKDCYTTALVGLRQGGRFMGGFVGFVGGTRKTLVLTMSDCYAAGEVGSTDITMGTDANGYQAQHSGGFIGAVTCTPEN